ncbi:MAG: divergent polysaccharide deacetylase family protein [Treponema sp.]|nr:divergent polysaccharide deacetylase family protein [Treponema sp.]
MALVIDDAGNNLRELEPFLAFPGPLTIAVLPGLPYSAEAARRIRAAGKELFLHQPMEALGGQNPGPGAVYSGMDSAEIRRIIGRNIDEIGPVAGINNHQGSKITMDEKAMETILALCRERGIHFLDSRTTADTAAPEAARLLGMKIGERDVFLDNVQEKAAMVDSLEAGLVRAESRGAAVMIGHTWSPELASVLTELYPGLIGRGYAFSTASRLIAGNYER